MFTFMARTGSSSRCYFCGRVGDCASGTYSFVGGS